MRKALLLAFALGWAPSSPASADAGTARVIVKFKTDSSVPSARSLPPAGLAAARARSLGARLGLPMAAGATVSDRAQVVLASGVTSDELARLLAAQSDVEYAVPDERRRIVGAPNDPLYAPGVPGE